MSTKQIPTTEEALEYAVRVIQCRDLAKGKAALSWVLKREPKNVVAWLWLSRCVQDAEAQLECMRLVSAINPYKN
jgi:hypothetical protein